MPLNIVNFRKYFEKAFMTDTLTTNTWAPLQTKRLVYK